VGITLLEIVEIERATALGRNDIIYMLSALAPGREGGGVKVAAKLLFLCPWAAGGTLGL